MDTDEYQISLSREIANCRAYIKKISRSLIALENKYRMDTDSFVRNCEQGRMSNQNPDFRKWAEYHASLKIWKQRCSEYEEIYHKVRA